MATQTLTEGPVGFLGGTFDPLHLGHLRIALEVAQQLAIADMRLLPNYLPPHRQTPLLSAEKRLAVLSKALESCPQLNLDLSEWQAVEQGKANAGYTVDSLRRLRKQLGNRPLVFVVGDDAFAAIDSWKEYQALPELCHLVVATRPGYCLPAGSVAAQWLEQYAPQGADALSNRAAGTVQRCEVTALDISATQIRELLAAGKSVRYLVPESVLALLEEK